MARQTNSSQSGHQDLKRVLTDMLEGVVLPDVSGIHEECIYIVSPEIRQTNPQAYTPRVVSIGPFHKPHCPGGNNIFVPTEQLKLQYLLAFLTRTQLCVGDFVLKLKEWENGIRNCYAETINYESNDFLKMILIDACFIVELFLRHSGDEDWTEKDPIWSRERFRSDIEEDLILLENQLPFFVLENIYELAGMTSRSFLKITCDYFTEFHHKNMDPERRRPKHFTDLLRNSMIPQSSSLGTAALEGRGYVRHLYSASQLLEAGLVFKVSQSKYELDLKYHEGVLAMPPFIVHDGTERYIRNLIAFEDCRLSSHSCYISQYFKILDFLINTEKDVNILVDKKIIVNFMGDAKSVAAMVKNLGKNAFMPRFNQEYLSLCSSLNEFYENPRNKYKAIFVHEYFSTPWKIASTIAAIVLLLLTLIQTICSVISSF
ncbi:UPF0481 protein At3g47200-like [Gastrolobium bilobum]|uniref:UPF0481 protein At3g47200-like n=1 Tax=Gastrolobium bilobum TaxID=150636 RepID=UPI002AB0B83B|nr:UPF0481 protein At3g47200-like [Gastrolobium bilobum]